MNTSVIERKGKIYMMAYDQGFEHGPLDLNDQDYNPEFVIDIAIRGGASCMTMQYGLANRFYKAEAKAHIPLILKLNGKTRLNSQNYMFATIATIEDALRLGAVGVGFTINPGQQDEHIGFSEFARIRTLAERHGLITVLWSYARGPEIPNQFDPNVVAYATRVAAELGADVIKVKYTGDPDSFAWAVKTAAGAKVLISGTDNFPTTEAEYIVEVAKSMKSGAAGIAVGRHVWQSPNALQVAREVANAVYG